MSFEEYLKKNIFLPFSMNSTGQDNARDVFLNRASGYTTMNGKHIHYDLQNIHNSWGAGSIHSITEDLFRWERASHTLGTILSSQSTDVMAENHYGIDKVMYKNRTVMGYGGRNFGFISYRLYYLNEDVSITFLSNHDRTPSGTHIKDLSAVVFDEPYTLPAKIDRKSRPLTSDVIIEYTGRYAPEWERSWTITVYPDVNRLFYNAVMPGDNNIEQFYESNDTFFVTPESNDAFIFTRNGEGKVDELKMYNSEGSYDKSEKIS